ncbi:DsbA family protein [Comamonas sp. J-3]|uniref:DsbA family protein n=1 Tax=Comamonas trifloxystrobinivorans TaxID=3350256 RepID=UPI00372A31CB
MTDLAVPVGNSDHILGKADAKLVLVEYGDYQCPYCGKAYPVVKQIAQQFADQVCVVFRNYPLAQSHAQALPAAVTAEFAAQHGKFWQAHDALYENQHSLGPALYVDLLQSLQLPVEEFKTAIENHAFETKIRADIDSGNRSGVNGTPAFFINGQAFQPRGGFDDLARHVEALLKG